jgi:hypothetical protein
MRAYFRRRFGPLQQEAHHILFQGASPTILSGPFRGMRYLNETVWGPITPKWIGSYEAELHGVLEEVVAARYTQIVNVGCAEGYYAAGLALRIPNAQVIAFDLDPTARRQTAHLASLVGVGHRVEVRGNCTPSLLHRLLVNHPLLMMDVEGAEYHLLDPSAAQNIRNAALLVEVHSSPPFDLPAVAESLHARLEATHDLLWLYPESRDDLVDRFRFLWENKISTDRFAEYLDEGRTEAQRWMWAKPKTAIS